MVKISAREWPPLAAVAGVGSWQTARPLLFTYRAEEKIDGENMQTISRRINDAHKKDRPGR
jgi:hypothetical protein